VATPTSADPSAVPFSFGLLRRTFGHLSGPLRWRIRHLRPSCRFHSYIIQTGLYTSSGYPVVASGIPSREPSSPSREPSVVPVEPSVVPVEIQVVPVFLQTILVARLLTVPVKRLRRCQSGSPVKIRRWQKADDLWSAKASQWSSKFLVERLLAVPVSYKSTLSDVNRQFGSTNCG
jgi:hypothetical protein